MMATLPQMPAQTGLASILAALGTAPAPGGNAGFEQLLATAPATGAAPANAAATVRIDLPMATPVSLPGAIDVAPVAIDGETAIDPAAPASAPATAPATAHPASIEGRAATDAANLLIALTGTAGTAPAPGKPAPAAPAGEGEVAVETLAADVAPTAAAPVAALLPAVPAAPAQSNAKPAKAAEARTPAPDGAPAAPTAAKPRPMALPALAGTAVPAVKPADAVAPSMAIVFVQTETQGASAPLAVAQPAVIAERVLDMTSDDLWIEQLARDIAATKSDSADISFRLMPRHLGRLDVAMRMEGEGVSVKLDTQHEATATIVTAAQGKLVEDLRQQGVRVAGAKVTCTPGETGRQSQQGQGRGTSADAAHLIETASDGADARADRPHDERTADRRGRFA